MQYITNELLVDSYQKAVELDLDSHFISLLQEEIHRRGIGATIQTGSGSQARDRIDAYQNA
jgi:hypothetical protein